MTTNPMETVDTSWKGLYKWGGVLSLTNGVLYIVATILFASLGATPSGGEAVLKWLSGQTTLAYTAEGVFVLTDILFVPVVLALYLSLKEVNKNAMLAAAGFLDLFVVLDLGVTVISQVGLTTLSQNYAAATSDIQRAAYVATTNYVLGVTAVGGPAYSFLVSSIGVLITSLVMLRGVFSKATAYLGLAVGIVGLVYSISLFVPALAMAAAITLFLWGVWFLLAGYRLYRLGKR
jgi:hypothetical protein